MKAGRLRHRLVIERRVESQDATTGAVTTSWERVDEVWAAIEPLSVREFIAAQAQQSEVTGKLVIRPFPGLTAKMRLRKGATIFDIAGVLPDNETGADYWTLPYSEGVNEG